MITMQEWKAMGGKEQTIWLELNGHINGRGWPRKLVQGVGLNESKYRTSAMIEGRQVVCPAYGDWANMLNRAYSPKHHTSFPTYIGVTVCSEWKIFSSFRGWWLEHHIDGFQLDKDILSDGAVYSPSSCIFVPQWLNSFTIDSGATRGAYPIGVYFHKGKGRFIAQCGNPMSKKQERLGYFTTPEEAHLAWLNRKLELALELKPKMDEIDIRIYPRVVEIINNAK